MKYNAACNAVIDLTHFRILINELLKKYPDIVPDSSPLIILDSNFGLCMANNGKDSKHTRYISRIVNFMING